MLSRRILFALIVGFSTLTGTAAYAVQWPALPAACLPDRANPWNSGISESLQKSCHCPPTELCPANFNEFVRAVDNDPDTAPFDKMPANIVRQCCERPTCPAGTDRAGQLLPEDLNCDIADSCPAGTVLAGQPTPADGNCNPAACPSKMYSINPLYGEYMLGIGLFGSNIGAMPVNLATPAVVAAHAAHQKKDKWGNVQGVEIGIAQPYDNGAFPPRVVYMEYQVKHTVDAIEKGASEYLNACRDVDGAHIGTNPNGGIQIEHRNGHGAGGLLTMNSITLSNGQQCHYMGCEYQAKDRSKTSCLGGDSEVTLADNSKRKVTELKVGDQVKGPKSVHEVRAINSYQSNDRSLYGINDTGPLLTNNHPVRTKDGWKVIDPTAAEELKTNVDFSAEPLKVGDVVLTEKGEVKIEKITAHPKEGTLQTYNIKLKGATSSFYADGIEVKPFSEMEIHY